VTRRAAPPVGAVSSGAIGFCPFCRECFEDTDQCPDHELPLVAFDALPRDRSTASAFADGAFDDGDTLPMFLPTFGRGWFALGAVIVAVGFVLPCVAFEGGQPHSLMDVALARAPNLWTVPCISAASLAMLARFRTPARLRSIRMAAVSMPIFGAASVALTAFRVWNGAAAGDVDVALLWGAAAAPVGLVIAVFGAFALGKHPASRIAAADERG
jgi:hypothetical protein